MNMSLTLKRMATVEMQLSDFVPDLGELIMDATSNKVKIGDGKTAIKDLPWIDYTIKEDSSLSRTARMFIENNIELIENNDYDTLYSHIATPALAQEVTRALLRADLNPKPYLSKIPQSIRHILEPDGGKIAHSEGYETLASGNYSHAEGYYTKSELDSMMQYSQAELSVIDEWNKKLFMQMGIPQSMIKVGN